jgi:hypothetical protein
MRLFPIVTCALTALLTVLLPGETDDATSQTRIGAQSGVSAVAPPASESSREEAGAAAASFAFDALAVGAHDEEVDGVGFAGAVNVIYGSASGLSSTDSQSGIATPWGFWGRRASEPSSGRPPAGGTSTATAFRIWRSARRKDRRRATGRST